MAGETLAINSEEERRKQELAAKYGIDLNDGGSAPDPNADVGSLAAKFGIDITSGDSVAPITEEADWLDKTRHVVAGGLTDFATGMSDAPYNLRELAEQGAEWATGKEEGEVDFRLPKAVRAHPAMQALGSLSDKKFSEQPGVRDIVEVTGKEMVTSDDYPLIDAARTGVDWGAGLLATPFTKAAKAPEVLMGLGAAFGDYMQNLAGSEGVFGEIAGGITGLIAALRRGKVSGMTKAEKAAQDFIDQNIQDPENTLKALEAHVASGSEEVGTLADVTGDRGIFNVEAGASLDNKFRSEVADIDIARQQQIAEEVRAPFGTGTPENAQVATQEAVENAQKRIAAQADKTRKTQTDLAEAGGDAAEIARLENTVGLDKSREALDQGILQADTAQEAADTAQQVVGTTQRPAQASARTHEVLAAEREAYKAAEQAEWNKFKAEPDVSIIDMRNSAAEAADRHNLSPDLRDEWAKVYKKELASLRKWGNTKAGADIHLWLRKVQNKIDARFKAGEATDGDIVMKAVKKEIEEGLAASNPLFREAKDKTKILKDQFDRGRTGEALANAEPEEFIRSAGGLVDESGAVLARKLLEQAKTPGMEPAIIEALKSHANRYGLDANFIDQVGDVLDVLPPSVRSDFQAAIDATDSAAGAADNVTALTKARKKAKSDAAKAGTDIDKGEIKLIKATSKAKDAAAKKATRLENAVAKTNRAKYAKAPNKTIDSLLKEGRGQELGDLYRRLEMSGEGDAFKAALGDRITLGNKKGSGLTLSGTNETRVTPGARGQYESIRAELENSDIFTQKELDGIAESLEKTKSVELRGNAWAERANQMTSEFDNLAASAAAAAALKLLPGSSLVMAGAVRRLAKKVIPGVTQTNEKQMAALEEYLKNPEKYLDDTIRAATTAEQQVKLILTKIIGASQAAEAMNEEE